MSGDPDVRWLGRLLRNPSTAYGDSAMASLVQRHGRDHVHRLLAIEYERPDGTRWRHEAGDRGEGQPRETRPEYILERPGRPPTFRGPMKWVDGRGLVG